MPMKLSRRLGSLKSLFSGQITRSVFRVTPRSPQGFPHDVDRGSGTSPELKGIGSLPQEHPEAVHRLTACQTCLPEKPRLMVDQVAHPLSAPEKRRLKREGVVGPQA